MKVDRRGAMQRFHLGGSRFEVAVDKNGKPWSFSFGRALPPYGHPNRQELMRVPETLHFSNQTKPAFHGLGCGGCVHFDFCKKHKGARENQNYCAMPKLGYMSLGAACSVNGFATLSERAKMWAGK